ncbi:metallophosphoesterase family protein [Peredibacter sp. HCB2-198]|uniref:metallophosphoesterase family protein n=1 Tax=Peredibacter sp. HCB2-198 TaxID=3383025 RepID=UPI0038B6A415
MWWKFCAYIFFITFVGCKYVLSPYSAETPTLRINQVNLEQVQARANEGPDFSVAFIADTHNYYDELDKLISTINARGGYRFVIVAGDITNLGLLAEYDESRQLFNKLNAPYLIAPGNHDLISNGDKIFHKMFGSENFSFEHQGVLFTLMNNNNWESGGEVPDFTWLTSVLSNSTAATKLIIAHVAPADTERFTDGQISRLTEIVSNNNVGYFINGHNHNPSMGTFGTAIQITIGAPSKGEYLEMTFQSGSVTYQKIRF